MINFSFSTSYDYMLIQKTIWKICMMEDLLLKQLWLVLCKVLIESKIQYKVDALACRGYGNLGLGDSYNWILWYYPLPLWHCFDKSKLGTLSLVMIWFFDRKSTVMREYHHLLRGVWENITNQQILRNWCATLTDVRFYFFIDCWFPVKH